MMNDMMTHSIGVNDVLVNGMAVNNVMMNDVTAVPPLRLLVVEDEALVALAVESILTDCGYDVVGIANNLRSAMGIATAERPDLALVDMQLSGGDSGLAVAAALRTIGTPTMFVTGNCPTESGAETDAELALGCLHKPFTDAALTDAVRAVAAVLAGNPPTTLPGAFRLF